VKLMKYFILQLFNNRNFTILFILNLSFGLCSFVTLDIFKSSINYSLKSRSKVLLGADFGLSARRPITKDEIKHINSIQKSKTETTMIEIFSMVAGPSNRSKLVQIKAVDQFFPFYGDIQLKDSSEKTYIGQTKNLIESPTTWIYPELLLQLNVKVGEKLKVGKVEFLVKAIVESDNAEGFTTSMAPRIYIGLPFLAKTELLQFGSVAWYTQLFHFPQFSDQQLTDFIKVFK